MRFIAILILIIPIFADFDGLGEPDSILKTPSIDTQIDSVIAASLEYLNIKPYELGFEKKYGGLDSFRLSVVDSMMDAPLYTAKYSDSLAEMVSRYSGRFAPVIAEFAHTLEDSVKLSLNPIMDVGAYKEELMLKGLPEDMAGAISYYIGCAEEAKRLSYPVFDSIDSLTRLEIVRDAAELWLGQDEDPDSSALEYLIYKYKPEYVDSIDENNTKSLLGEMDMLNYDSLYSAFVIYSMGLDTLTAWLRDSSWYDVHRADSTDSTEKTDIRPVPYFEGDIDVPGIDGKAYATLQTDIGTVIIGDSRTNKYYADFPMIIDLGGNDEYRNRGAFALGYFGDMISSIFDLGGNDLYLTEEWFFSQASAVMGFSSILDAGGDDIYRSGGYSQASAICGLAILSDLGGDDIMRAGEHSQAAATFGMAILYSGGQDDERKSANYGSDDDYRAYRYAQGFGSVKAVGLLHDTHGDDSYYAGGQYLHEPLHPQLHQSMSQGFGFGWRGAASGGIGALIDERGNDNYWTQIYGQGSSYWYAFGLLYDVTGHDTYQMGHYGQGAGIHLSVGSLVDRRGEDAYYGRRGPSQGCAHDWAVGYMFDGGGPDYYSADGIAWGQGHANGIGIFIDRSGPDVYGGKSSGHVQGTASAARGYGGLGLFYDLGGDDRYIRDQGKNDRTWIKGIWGIGVDAALNEEGDM